MAETKVQTPQKQTGVSVVGKDEAVTVVTDPIIVADLTLNEEDLDDEIDSMIVANVNGKYVRFEKLEWVPAGAKCYTSKRELESNSKESLEKMYAFVKGVSDKKFPSKEMALNNLWDAFGKLPMFDPVKDEPPVKAEPAKVDAKKQKKRATNIYVMKPETDSSKKRVSDLAPQAKTCHDILREHANVSKKTEFTEDEVRELFEKNKTVLRTKQPAFRIFQYYKSHLIAADVLTQK